MSYADRTASPTATRVVSLSLSPDTLATLDRLARRRETSRSEMVAYLVAVAESAAPK
jgi:metal-responsive CopG/Arc/MetJ family transcriptional regulator